MIIDCHSHIGKDYYCGNIELTDYVGYCQKVGIDVGLVMPTPWPIYVKENTEIVSLLWEHDNYKYRKYFRYVNKTKQIIDYNPYKEINEFYNNIISSYKGNQTLYFVPLVHGILDLPDYIEKLIKVANPVAMKMHGFGSGFSPEEINPEITEILKFYELPLILHTSVYNYDYGYGASTKYWRNECHPLRWAKYIKNHGLRGVLNHGACLNDETIRIVNSSENLMIGIGPDLDISKDYFKLDVEKKKFYQIKYLQYLKQNVKVSKLLFDIDFCWNINPENNQLDYDSIERMKNVWNSQEQEKVLSKNAIGFFRL